MGARGGMASKKGAFFSAGGAAAGSVALLGLAQQIISQFSLRVLPNLLIVALFGVFGWWTQRLLVLGRRAEAARAADAALAVWPVGSVSRAHEFDLGVHPPMWAGANAYVRRDLDDQLEAALDHGPEQATFVLLHGPAGSGKSRTAFEGLRRMRGDALLLVPEDGAALMALAAAPPRLERNPAGIVLWLDGLERFLEGLQLDGLISLALPGAPFTVVATITDAALGDLLAGRPPAGHIGRRFVARARLIEVPGELSVAEREAAASRAAGLDFSGGFGPALSEGWDRARPPDYRVLLPSMPSSWSRMCGWFRSLPSEIRGADRLAAGLAAVAIGLAGLLVLIGVTQGLINPPPVATQLADLHRQLSPCGIQTFSTTSAEAINRGDPLIVATNPDLPCPARTDARRPVLVYDKRHDRLEQVTAFGPPLEMAAVEGSRFVCRGSDPVDRCWSDIGSGYGVGTFVGAASGTTFPVGMSHVDGRFVADALISRPPALKLPFDAPVYRQALRLLPATRAGYRAKDFAVAAAPPGDDVGGERLVVGYPPLRERYAPRQVQLTAQLLGLDGHGRLVVTGRCVAVRPDRGVDQLKVPAGKPLDVFLSEKWTALEKTTQTVCF